MKLPEFFGIDIGSHSIKVAQVQQKGEGKAKLEAIGHLETPVGILSLEDDNAKTELANKIKQIHSASGISTKKVVAALPESTIFTRIILLPDVPEKDLEESVYYEAKQYLPTPVSDVQLDYIPISKVQIEGKNLIRALLVAAPKAIAQKYIDVMELAGLELLALETETIATARAVSFVSPLEQGALVLDFGSAGTDVSVIKGRNLIFSQSIGTGSDQLTKAITADFGLDYQQAEQYKRTYGLLSDQADGKIANSLAPIMQVIINEINKTINYFRAHLQESTPKQILIVGDGAKLPGLPEYLTQNLGIQARVEDPIQNLEIKSSLKSEIAQLSTVGFTVAVGLSLKSE